jgi:DNA-binding SARP family transcriptional activator
VDFGLLWPLEVRVGGEPIGLGRLKQRAVLAVLLIHANQVDSLDRLIDLPWDEEVAARAAGALQAYISNLRKALEPDRPDRQPPQILVTRAPGYVLLVDPDQLDATRFETLAESARQRLAVTTRSKR